MGQDNSMSDTVDEEHLKQLAKNRWSYEMLVMDNDPATKQPMGAASLYTPMRGGKRPISPRQERNDAAVLRAPADRPAWSPSEPAWEPAPDNTSSLRMTSL